MAGNKGTAATVLKVWKIMRGLTGDDLVRLQNAPVSLAITGEASRRDALAARIGASSHIAHYGSVAEAIAAGESAIVDSNSAEIAGAAGLTSVLTAIALKQPESRIALAAKFPVFRPIVADQLTVETARINAKVAALSALPGIIPFTDWLMPATAAGDILVLTRNQIDLLLQISACYNLPPDPKARLMELVPVVGSAFGWRAIARELVGLVPGGIGVGIKAAIAYAGTFAIGKAANAYYAGGKNIDMSQLYRDAIRAALSKANLLMKRPKPASSAVRLLETH